MVILGIVLIAVGIVEFVVVSLYARRQAVAAGLGEGPPPAPATIVLRRTAMMEVAIGALLLVIGLLS